MNLIEIQILKSRSGVYKDTSKNRRLHRVGQRYGEGKKEEAEDDKKSVDSIMEKFSDMFFDRNVSKNTLENFIEKYLGKGSFNEAWEKVDKRKFDSSTEKDNAFVREIQNMLVEKQGSKKEVEPSKELEAVNKVIAAINEGKMNLPASEALKLTEKKKKLEAKVKDEVSKENKAEKSASKKYDKMSIEEAKKELLGKELSIADNETGKTRIEKITSIVEGNVRGHSTVMARVEGGGTYPIKHIGTGKEWKAWKLDIVSGDKRKITPPEQKSSSTGLSLDSVKEAVQTTDKEEGWKAKINKEDIGKVVGKDNFGNELKIGDRLYRSEYLRGGKWGSSIVRISRKDGNDIKVVGEDIPMEFSYRSGDKIITEENGKSYVNIQLDGKKYKLEMDERDRSVTDPDTGKRYHAIDDFYDELFENKRKSEKESKKKETPKSEDTQKEKYTRVKFDDLPNSGKVNLKKYLSEKVRKGVDEKWSNIKNIPTDNLKKMEKGLVNDLNKNFEAIKKSQRAELLYSIMKVKGELERRGKESQKKE